MNLLGRCIKRWSQDKKKLLRGINLLTAFSGTQFEISALNTLFPGAKNPWKLRTLLTTQLDISALKARVNLNIEDISSTFFVSPDK